jgi:cytoskeletal protein RodZ
MKEPNIDQLFRQKLQQHTVSPAPTAWDKVHAGLNTRRRKRGGYYAAAAAVILLLSAGWLGLQQYQQQGDGSPSQPTLAVQDRAMPSPVTLSPEPSLAEQSVAEQAAEPANSPATNLQQAPQQAVALAQQDKAAPKPSRNKGVPAVTAQALPQAESLPAEAALARQQVLPHLKSQQGSLDLSDAPLDLPSAEWALASAEPVIIRYELKDQLRDEPLDEDEERDSAPEKVLALFQKVKHGEIGLAGIRQAKDNLLSGRINKP